MTDVGVNMTLNPVLHNIPSNIIALSPKVLKIEACVAACRIAIPRWDRSIFELWLYMIRFPFSSADVMLCAVGCLSLHG